MNVKVTVRLLGEKAEIKIHRQDFGDEVIKISSAKVKQERVGSVELYHIEGSKEKDK